MVTNLANGSTEEAFKPHWSLNRARRILFSG